MTQPAIFDAPATAEEVFAEPQPETPANGPEAQPEQESAQGTEPAKPEAPPTIPDKLLDMAVEETLRVDPDLRRQLAEEQAWKSRFVHDQQFAKLAAASGAFDLKGRSREEAIALAVIKIRLGRELGMSDVVALKNIYVIRGNPGVSAEWKVAQAKRAGYGFQILRLDDKGCSLIPLGKDGKPIMVGEIDDKGRPTLDKDGRLVMRPAVESYTEADAKRAGLHKPGGGYTTNPRNMYFWRAASNAIRFYMTEVLAINLPSVEELGEEAAEVTRPVFQRVDGGEN